MKLCSKKKNSKIAFGSNSATVDTNPIHDDFNCRALKLFGIYGD